MRYKSGALWRLECSQNNFKERVKVVGIFSPRLDHSTRGARRGREQILEESRVVKYVEVRVHGEQAFLH